MAATSPFDKLYRQLQQEVYQLSQMMAAYDRQVEHLATNIIDQPEKYGPELDKWLVRRKMLIAESFEVLTDARRCLAEVIARRRL